MIYELKDGSHIDISKLVAISKPHGRYTKHKITFYFQEHGEYEYIASEYNDNAGEIEVNSVRNEVIRVWKQYKQIMWDHGIR